MLWHNKGLCGIFKGGECDLPPMADPAQNVIARNPSAGRDFVFLETFEAGIELNGAEVKSLRARRANMREAFARIDKGQVFLYGLDITPWPQSASRQEPKRPRRLLLHKEQIERLEGKMAGRGLTLAATKLYFKKALVKVEIVLAQGKKQFDRREDIKKREADIEISRALKHDVRKGR